ncbi:MAG: ZIP family metal transporter [Oscillospiraceae bacterium]|nr:ZIP family metal transporter [Oscillospiraceae bacterium]
MAYAIWLCTVASAATGAGGLIVALCPGMSGRTLAFFQGFAAGVMTGISAFNMLPNSFASLSAEMGTLRAAACLSGLFICGWAVSVVLARISVPDGCGREENAMKSVCIITTMVIVMHNLPEGMLTAFSGYSDRSLGADMAFAVALHNIPEGVAVASSVMCVTSSRIRAVVHSFAAGMAELAGGAAALLLLHNFITPQLLNCVLAVISGIMVQVSVCQLIPGGVKLHSKSAVLCGIIAGAATIFLGILII